MLQLREVKLSTFRAEFHQATNLSHKQSKLLKNSHEGKTHKVYKYALID